MLGFSRKKKYLRFFVFTSCIPIFILRLLFIFTQLLGPIIILNGNKLEEWKSVFPVLQKCNTHLSKFCAILNVCVYLFFDYYFVFSVKNSIIKKNAVICMKPHYFKLPFVLKKIAKPEPDPTGLSRCNSTNNMILSEN